MAAEYVDIVQIPAFLARQTDILVSGINSGSKLRKAQELGIKILTEKEFIDMLENNNE